MVYFNLRFQVLLWVGRVTPGDSEIIHQPFPRPECTGQVDGVGTMLRLNGS